MIIIADGKWGCKRKMRRKIGMSPEDDIPRIGFIDRR